MIKHIGIVGGSCVDIFATSALPLVAHDSNPGTVNIGYGGVGRNMAENLARLSQDVLLIAPFGQDPFSAHMLQYTAAADVNTRHVFVSEAEQAPYYISVNDCGGEMSAAVNDMKICEQITPDFLAGKLPLLNQCDAVILDTNIPQVSIEYLAARCATPLFAEAVSTHKAMKLKTSLPYLFAIKANLQEAEALLGESVSSGRASLCSAAARFHSMGISHVFITLGKQGAFYSTKDTQLLQAAYPTQPVNTNGCGDAFGAAAFLGILRGDPPETLLKSALAAAAITAQSPQAVSPTISSAAIETFLETR